MEIDSRSTQIGRLFSIISAIAGFVVGLLYSLYVNTAGGIGILSVGVLAFIVFILSLVSEYVRKNIDFFNLIYFLYASLLMVYFTYSTNLAPELVFTLIIAAMAIGLAPFRHLWMQWLYMIVLTIATLTATALVEEPRTNPIAFIAFFLVAVVMSFVLLGFRTLLQNSVKRLALLAQFSPNPIMEFDQEGIVTFMNKAAMALFPGVSVKSKQLGIFNPGEIKKQLGYGKSLTKELRSGTTIISQEIVYFPETGVFKVYMADVSRYTKLSLELRAAKEELENQKMALMNVLDDVNEQKKLQEAQSILTLENIGEGVVLTNDSGVVVYINPAFAQMTGYHLSDLGGQEFASSIKAYDFKGKPVLAELLSDAGMITARRQETKLVLKKKGGGDLAVIINATPIKVSGRFGGVVRVVHDYSEDYRLQRQKDDFFSIASHELRTPLTVISGNLNILRAMGASLTSEQSALVEDVEEASDRLIKLVNDFLNVSRLDQGRLKVNVTIVDLCSLAGKIVSEMKVLTDKKGLGLSYSCDSERIMVKGDEELVREIIVNLVGNSLKFTNEGEININVYQRDGKAYLRVADSGIGVDKTKQGLLFQRFQQAMDRTLSRDAGGTGLGLYISREFARLMGGDLVLVSSDKGKGSVFECHLQILEDKN